MQPNPTGSQSQRVLHKLLSQDVVHCREFSKMRPAIMSYTARLSELRKKGYVITNHEKRVKGELHSWYTLDGMLRKDSLQHTSDKLKASQTEMPKLTREQLEEGLIAANGVPVIQEILETRKQATRAERTVILIMIVIAACMCYAIYFAFK